MIVPLKGKAKGFRIKGANPYEGLMKDSGPTEFEAKLLAGGVGIVKTVGQVVEADFGQTGPATGSGEKVSGRP